jgi:hypothetical protein
MAAHAEHAALENGEEADGAGADDSDIGTIDHSGASISCFAEWRHFSRLSPLRRRAEYD